MIQTLRNMLDGKTVAIIGNAESLFDEDRSEAIDAYDYVLRMNCGVRLSEEQLRLTTRRCEIYTCSGYGCINKDMETDRPKVRVSMSPRHRDKAHADIFYPIQWWRELQHEVGEGYRPTTGAMVIDMISRMPVTGVGVFGMDHWKTKTFYNGAIWTPDHYSPREKTVITLMIDERFKWII